jgi:hypothetical protein
MRLVSLDRKCKGKTMSDTLTTLISKVQAVLGDDGTIFSTATLTAAIRQALSEWNMRAPVHAATTITGVDDQYEYELTDYDANAVEIFDVLKQGDNNGELDISLTHDAYIEDERLFFRLRHPVTSSDTLIARYTLQQTINGLDSATESTIPSHFNQAMIDGGAYFAIFIRAISKIETVNLSKDQSDNYREMAGYFGSAFAARIAQAARRKSPVGEPDTRAWNDEYHSMGQ